MKTFRDFIYEKKSDDLKSKFEEYAEILVSTFDSPDENSAKTKKALKDIEKFISSNFGKDYKDLLVQYGQNAIEIENGGDANQVKDAIQKNINIGKDLKIKLIYGDKTMAKLH